MNWYLIFNLAEFLETEMISKKVTVFLEGKGVTEFLIVQGQNTNVIVDDVFLPIGFNSENPWIEDGVGVFVDSTDGVWIGYET